MDKFLKNVQADLSKNMDMDICLFDSNLFATGLPAQCPHNRTRPQQKKDGLDL